MYRTECGRKYRGARRLLPADMRPAGGRSIPAETASARRLPAERSLRILRSVRSRLLLSCYCRAARCRRFLIQTRILINMGFKRHISLGRRLCMAQKEITARLKIFIEPLDQL